MDCKNNLTAKYHLPGLFEFYDFYKEFLPLYHSNREWFYDWCEIASIYGAPSDCLWGGGRMGLGDNNAEEIHKLLNEYGISARLTFSNSLLREEHLSDRKCNKLCKLFSEGLTTNGVIVHSDLLVDYLKEKYPTLYLVSSTTKVITAFEELKTELGRDEFKYVVPDFRINKMFENLLELDEARKNKVEFLCNECCYTGCTGRKECYENVSAKILGEDTFDHICASPDGSAGYKFSKAMRNPAFISVDDIKDFYLPNGFTNFKIEGRTLGSALLLEFILYYMVKPEHHLEIREALYLDSMLNLF